MSGSSIAGLISQYRFRWNGERELQDRLEQLLIAEGIDFEREYRLSARDRVDFMCGGVAIEVKIASSHNEVLTQLFRYAESTEVEAMILVTNRHRQLEMPTTILGKPLEVVFLNGLSW
jgi:hypothetical protein